MESPYRHLAGGPQSHRTQGIKQIISRYFGLDVGFLMRKESTRVRDSMRHIAELEVREQKCWFLLTTIDALAPLVQCVASSLRQFSELKILGAIFHYVGQIRPYFF